ncbi:MAG: N-acyl amino acid synthase FeeM domain-containing protein [Allorhizobium sp.]
MSDIQPSTESFSSRLMEVLNHVEYRRVESGEDMEEVARIRYKAYKMADILTLSGTTLIDDVDFDPQAYVFGVYYDERLISTVRMHHVTPDHRVSSSRDIFPEQIDAFLDAGMTLIDPVRFAADPEIMKEMPAIPYLTLRIAIMAAAYFDTDRVLQLVSPQHAAFYRRVFQAQTIVPPQQNCGKYNIDLTLMATNTRETGRKLLTRYPFFVSQPYERRLMFSRNAEISVPSLTILPTARYVPAGSFGVELPA